LFIIQLFSLSGGCVVLESGVMLMNQDVMGVKYWTGLDVKTAVMGTKLREIFSAATTLQ
jgi:shikimate dehydrogenase